MKPLTTAAQILLIIAVPVFIVTATVRLIVSPTYLKYEYNLPGFPPDSYGFTTQDRLKWATITFDFFWTAKDASYFNQFTLPDGLPLYNDRELSHMHDVKVLADNMVLVLEASMIILLLGGLVAWRVKGWRAFFRSLSRGGWVMLSIVAIILLGVLFAFNWFFTEFHHIFFVGNSWLFYYSDTFIRLFPIQFWQDLFLLGGVFCTIFGLIFGFVGRRLAKKL